MTDVDTTTPARLPDVEAWLDDHQIAWVLDTVDLADVDVPAGYKNQTRLDAIHDGTPVETAARAVGVAVDKLRRKVAVEKFTKRAAGLQMRDWTDTSESARQILISIKDDRVFRRATRLVADRKVLAAEVGPLVARINASTAGAALDELSEIDKAARTRRDPGRPVSFNTSPRRRLISELDQLISRFAPAAVADDCETDMARQQASDQIKAAARHLMKIEKQLWRSAGA